MHALRVVLATLFLVGTVHAAPSSANAEAKKRYLSGSTHYELSEFEPALEDFREAYRLRDDPVFLYNIAQCYRQLKKPEDAIQFYKTYLRRVPNAPNRAEVQARIVTLEQEIASRPPPEPAPAPVPAPAPAPIIVQQTVIAPAPAPKPVPIYKKWWLWTAVGGVVAVGLGVGLGVGLTRGGHSPPTYSGVNF